MLRPDRYKVLLQQLVPFIGQKRADVLWLRLQFHRLGIRFPLHRLVLLVIGIHLKDDGLGVKILLGHGFETGQLPICSLQIPVT